MIDRWYYGYNTLVEWTGNAVIMTEAIDFYAEHIFPTVNGGLQGEEKKAYAEWYRLLDKAFELSE